MRRKSVVAILILLYATGMSLMPIMFWSVKNYPILIPFYVIGFPISMMINYIFVSDLVIKKLVAHCNKKTDETER